MKLLKVPVSVAAMLRPPQVGFTAHATTASDGQLWRRLTRPGGRRRARAAAATSRRSSSPRAGLGLPVRSDRRHARARSPACAYRRGSHAVAGGRAEQARGPVAELALAHGRARASGQSRGVARPSDRGGCGVTITRGRLPTTPNVGVGDRDDRRLSTAGAGDRPADARAATSRRSWSSASTRPRWELWNGVLLAVVQLRALGGAVIALELDELASQAEQRGGVVAQHGGRDVRRQLEPVELGEAGLGVEHRVVGAEAELPAQPARDLALTSSGR